MFFLQAKYQHSEEVTKDMSLFLKKLNWITQSNYSHLNYFFITFEICIFANDNCPNCHTESFKTIMLNYSGTLIY